MPKGSIRLARMYNRSRPGSERPLSFGILNELFFGKCSLNLHVEIVYMPRFLRPFCPSLRLGEAKSHESDVQELRLTN